MKLARPRVPPNYVTRTHLTSLLDRGTKRPVTVVSAGAGWGKTLATAAWAESGPEVGPVAWISLDSGDNEPHTFWTCFVAALRGALDVPRDNPIAELAPGLGNEDFGLQRLVAGLEQLSAPVVVVLDDFHLVDSPSVLAGLASLVRHPLEQLRLVIVTRSDPALPLHRLRMTDDLSEIRSRELAFDEEDAAAMFSADDLQVTPADVRLLLRRTEGWPAGMRLAALYLGRGDPSRDPEAFAGDDEVVTDYLVGEVLASHTPDVQRFLLRTSIAEWMSSGLAEALTDETHAQHHLESLVSTNSFVVGLGPGREWFQYHALLREMLRHRLSVEDPEAVPDLHRRAARWFADNDHPIEAMRHAADAEDWHLLSTVFVTRAVTLVVSADRAAVARELVRVPPERLSDGVNLAVCAAAQLFLTGRYADMEPYLVRARGELERLGPDAPVGTEVACLLLTTAVLRGRGDIDGVRLTTRRALDLLSGPGVLLPGATEYRAIALANLGTALLWLGRLEESGRSLTEGLASVEGTRLDMPRINLLAHLALGAIESGRLSTAFEHATAAVELVEARGWAPLAQAATAYLALSAIRFRRNDVSGAEQLLEQAEAAAERDATARWAVMLAGARLDAALGRLSSARRRMTALAKDLDGRELPPFLTGWRALAVAEIDLAAGDPEPASPLIERVRGQQQPSDAERVCAARALLVRGEPRKAEEVLVPLRERLDSGVAVEAWLLTALAAERVREDNRAIESMSRAIGIAEVEGVRRPFIEVSPEHVARLLALVRRLEPGTDDFVDELFEQVRPHLPGVMQGVLAEPLTERELIVLRFLPTMMTNAEIAEALFVSVNTVKAHLKRIFTKLEVASRRDAVHRARDLGLLSDTTV